MHSNCKNMEYAPRGRASSAGFTLIEVMVVIAILAVFVTMVLPSYTSTMDKESLTSVSFDYSNSVKIARSAAVKAGTPVVLCASDDGDACSADWAEGWMIFRDDDRDGAINGDEPVLRVVQLDDAQTSIVVSRDSDNATLSSVAFDYRGSPGTSFTAALNRRTEASVVSVNALGKPEIK